MHRLILSLVLLALVVIPNLAQTPPQPSNQPATPSWQNPASTSSAAKNDYANPDTWLCRPDLPTEKNACNVDLTTTVIAPDGSTSTERFTPNPTSPIDCFYVYPTVSTEPTGNADMTAGPEERAAVRNQFARFAGKCHLYAPLYRQATLAYLRSLLLGAPLPIDRDVIYNDVLDAWNYYLAHDNHGRGVVLIGHSQGAGVLTLLLKNEFDGTPIQKQLVSAMLLGTNIAVPKVSLAQSAEKTDAGGAFQHIPLCHSAAQTACVISYVSFRATQPPSPAGLFGHVPGENVQAACTNPASLGGGAGELHPYFGTHGVAFVAAEAVPEPWLKSGAPITTPFVSLPGLLTAECLVTDSTSYLAITVHSDPPALSSAPSAARTNTITGDLVIRGQILPEWGLHLIDVSEAMGNLLDIVAQQSSAYLPTAKQKK